VHTTARCSNGCAATRPTRLSWRCRVPPCTGRSRRPITKPRRSRVLALWLPQAVMESLCRSYGANFGLRTAIVRVFSAYGEAFASNCPGPVPATGAGGRALTLDGTGASVATGSMSMNVVRASCTWQAVAHGAVSGRQLRHRHGHTVADFARPAGGRLGGPCTIEFSAGRGGRPAVIGGRRHAVACADRIGPRPLARASRRTCAGSAAARATEACASRSADRRPRVDRRSTTCSTSCACCITIRARHRAAAVRRRAVPDDTSRRRAAGRAARARRCVRAAQFGRASHSSTAARHGAGRSPVRSRASVWMSRSRPHSSTAGDSRWPRSPGRRTSAPPPAADVLAPRVVAAELGHQRRSARVAPSC